MTTNSNLFSGGQDSELKTLAQDSQEKVSCGLQASLFRYIPSYFV